MTTTPQYIQTIATSVNIYAGSSILLTYRSLYIFCGQKQNSLQENMTHIYIN